MKVILVTGGAGFIGSHFVRYFLRRNKGFIVINLDKLTQEGNLDNLRDIDHSPRHHFIKGDICNHELVNYVLKRYQPDYIVHFAEASTQDEKDIHNPIVFAQTNILGTLTLLESARYFWGKKGFEGKRFIQVSTDQVYGNTEKEEDYFLEESGLRPDSLYASTKSGADLVVRAFSRTYGLPVITTRCCNNYGPYQNTQGFIPQCIIRAMQDQPIDLGRTGFDTREWIYVIDHIVAIIRALFYGKPGETYNIGSGEEASKAELAKKIVDIMGKPCELIEDTNHKDKMIKRCRLNSYKAKNNLNWSSKYRLEEGLKQTLRWYTENETWWRKESNPT